MTCTTTPPAALDAGGRGRRASSASGCSPISGCATRPTGSHALKGGYPTALHRLGDRLQGAVQLPLAHGHAGERATTTRSPTASGCARRSSAASTSAGSSRSVLAAHRAAASASASSRDGPRPRTRPRRSSSSSRPTSGPESIPSSSISSSPRTGGARRVRRARRAPRRQLARQRRHGSRSPPAACARRGSRAGRRPTAAVTSSSTGSRRAHVAVHVPPRQRALVHEEAEPQVVLRERGEEVARARCWRACAARGRELISRAHAVVAPEEHPALVGDRARRRLAGVVQQRAEPQRLAARQLVGKRARELARDSLGGVAEAPPRGRAVASTTSCSSTSSVWPHTSRWW